MTPFLFSLLFLVSIAARTNAQEDVPTVKTGFGRFEYTCYTTDRTALAEYPWRALDSNFWYMEEYDNSAFAYRSSSDSFTVVENALLFNRIYRVDTLHKGKKDMCLVIQGESSSYGSGGGTVEGGITILRLNPHVVLFRVINSSMAEAFERQDVKADVQECLQQIKITGDKLVIKKAVHSRRKHMEFGCGIDIMAPGTYVYKNDSFQKTVTPSKK